MSFDPSGIPISSYKGTPFVVASNIGNPPLRSPRFVPITLNWLVYWQPLQVAQIAVPIDLSGGQTAGLLDQIRGVKIDNTNSTISVSVYFPDTGDIITCGPETIVTAPAMTNGLRAVIIAQNLSQGSTPQTRVYLTNFFLPPNSDVQLNQTFPQWIGSPTQQRSNLLTPGYGPPALGDQVQSQSRIFNGAPNALFGTPRASGIIIMTGFSVEGTLVALNDSATIQVYGAIYGNIYNFNIATGGNFPIIIPIFNRSAMNLRFDATDSFFIVGAGSTGSYNYQLEYCYQP